MRISHHSGSDKRVLSIASFLSMLITGLAITSLAPLLVPISDFFHLETAQAVFPVLFNSLGFFSASIIVSFIWRIHRARLLLTFSSLFLLMSLVGIVIGTGVGDISTPTPTIQNPLDHVISAHTHA